MGWGLRVRDLPGSVADPQEELLWVTMRETLEALSSLGFSVGQPEMVPQSEPREGSHNVQEQMSSSREERALGVCSGHKAPTPEEGARTEQAEAPCRGQACTAQKAQPVGACPGDEWMIRKVKVEDEDQEAEEEVEWPQHLSLLPSPFPAPDLGHLAAAYKLEPGTPETLSGLALSGVHEAAGPARPSPEASASPNSTAPSPTPSPPGPKPFACSDCGLSFGWKKNLATHQCLHRSEGRPYGCNECALGATVDPPAAEPLASAPGGPGCGPGSDPVAPQRAPSGERSFFCPDCGRGFAHGQHLARHRRVHTGERPFACTQCDRRFGSRPNLVAHSRAHSGARPFACAQCGRRFSRKSHLGRHQAVHTGSRPHACAVCARSFSSKTNLVRHQAIHTGSRPFSCPQCGKSFSRKTHLVRHQLIHREAAHAAPDAALAAPAWSTTPEVAPPPLFF
ncbi:hypothetical protein H8959_007741 [Pygathrix nigripes]